jgi:hypothetical protein
VVETLDQIQQGLEDVQGLLELAVEADDEETFNGCSSSAFTSSRRSFLAS